MSFPPGNVAATYPPRTKTGTLVFVLAAIAGVVLVAVWCGGSFKVTVTKWSAGSSDVSGWIENDTGSGCTDPEITLTMRDHNSAIVREFTFGAGDLASRSKRDWTTHVVGLLMVDEPVPANVTSITGAASCADQH
jgi:hypothetical protein